MFEGLSASFTLYLIFIKMRNMKYLNPLFKALFINLPISLRVH
jgi:hypothetical protein